MSTETKPYHHGNLKEALLRAAVDIGRTEGPQAITIRHVTRTVGVSPTAAYRHFKDQSEMMDAVAIEALSQLVDFANDALDQVPTDADPAEKLMASAWAYFDYSLKMPQCFQCMVASKHLELPSPENPAGGLITAEKTRGIMARLGEFFIDFARMTTEDEPKHFFENAFALWSTVHGFTVLCTSGQLDLLNLDQKKEMARAAFASAIRGLDFSNPSRIHSAAKQAV